MAKFSDRLGITQLPKEIQINLVNDDLRTSLWNWIVEILQYDGGKESVPILWKDYLKKPIHILSDPDKRNLAWLHGYFLQCEWYEAYNLVEFVFQHIVLNPLISYRKDYDDKLNRVLERELSGYRMINHELVPIADEQEIESIREAISVSASVGLDGPSLHIKKALSLLGRKPEPDYANSIKESISAVESLCKLLSEEKSGGLDKALSKLAAKTEFHPALKQALLNLYGYTSDESGIRHAILETKDIGFTEAKFMLVACSAFVNFVLEKARQAKLL